MQTKLLHIISPPLCWEMQLSASNFEKGGLWNLKSSYHQHLHGVLTMLLVKKDFLIQNMTLRSQFQMLIWPVLAKQPIDV